MNRSGSLDCIQVESCISAGKLDGFFDLLQLTRQAPNKSLLSIKKVESNGRIHLKFRKRASYSDARCLQAERDEQLVRCALRQLIFNAIAEVKSRVPATQLEHVPALLDSLLPRRRGRLPDTFTPAAIQQLLARTGEAISKATNAELGRSSAERNAPRTPSDCLIDWIAFLSKSNLPLAGVLLQEARHCWEHGQVNLHNLTALLKKAHQQSGTAAHGPVQHKAQCLLVQSAVAQEQLCTDNAAGCPISEEQLPYTQLHDNLYGRVFDSALAAYLLHCPPEEVLRATHDLCLYLANCLTAMTKADARAATRELCMALRSDVRFWTPVQSELEPLLHTVSGSERLYYLQRILRGKPQDGGDILLRQSIAVKLMVAMRDVSAKSVPWMNSADYNYCAVVQPQRKRLTNVAAEVGAARPTGGITFSYQPSILPQHWMIPSIRPSEWYKPDFADPSTSILVALESGMPYVSGLSGSTNLILHLANHMKKKDGHQVDMQHVLLSILMFVVYDGGHSIHEVMWIGNYLNTVLDLGLNFEENAHPMKYVGSTAQFERLFAASVSAEDIRVAKHAAWQKTMHIFHTYSYYAPT